MNTCSPFNERSTQRNTQLLYKTKILSTAESNRGYNFNVRRSLGTFLSRNFTNFVEQAKEKFCP